MVRVCECVDQEMNMGHSLEVELKGFVSRSGGGSEMEKEAEF